MSESIALSPETERRLVSIFPEEDQALVRLLLREECGHRLPGNTSPELLERIRIAVLKESDGSLEQFDEAIKLAKIDWRDLLVAAGFR